MSGTRRLDGSRTIKPKTRELINGIARCADNLGIRGARRLVKERTDDVRRAGGEMELTTCGLQWH